MILAAALVRCGSDSDGNGGDQDVSGADAGPDSGGSDATGDGGPDPTDASDVGPDADTSDVSPDGSDIGVDDVEALPRPTIALTSSIGCAVDSECDTGRFCFQGACVGQCDDGADCASGSCDARGRCEASDRKDIVNSGPPTDVLPGVTLVSSPNLTLYVGAGETEVEVMVETSAPVLAQGGLAYRLDSSDDPTIGSQVFVSDGDTEHTIVIPTGNAEPGSENPSVVRVYVTTSAGSFPVTLIPERSEAGVWGGEFAVAGLGGVTLPIEFELVLEPEGASLEEATSRWVVMNTGPQDLYAPMTRSAAPDGVATELVYNELLARWVAIFRNGFDIPSDQIFGFLSESQVRREIRLEFEFEADGTLFGTMSDRWTGLFDASASDGTQSVQTLLVDGDLVANRVVGPRPLSEIASLPAPIPSSPALQPDAEPTTECLALSTNCGGDGFAARATCALEIYDIAMSGATISETIAAYLAAEPDELVDGLSFEQFLEECAAGTLEVCQESPEAQCALQAVAWAFSVAPSEASTTKDELWQAFADLQVESSGARQLVAFYSDIEARRDWLQNSTFGSTPITEAAAAQLNEELMEAWVEQVVDVHLDVLRTYMQPATFSFLTRAPDSETASDQRDRILIGMVSAWRASADSLALGALRWSEMYRLDRDRAEAAERVGDRVQELYLSGLTIIQAYRNIGRASQSAVIATGLSGLMQRQAMLDRPFDSLLFARDGEVVVSTSLDPRDTSGGSLALRRDRAETSIAEAQESVEEILADLYADRVNQAFLLAFIDDKVAIAEGNLAVFCGLPVGCSTSDSVLPDCESSWVAGECGFAVSNGPLEGREVFGLQDGTTVTSDAAEAVLEYRSAVLDLTTAEGELANYNLSLQRQYATVNAFAAAVLDWAEAREATAEAVQTALDAEVERQDGNLATTLTRLQGIQSSRTAQLAARRADVAQWGSLRTRTANASIGLLVSSQGLQATATALNGTADTVREYAEAIRDGLPTVVGLGTDPSFGARLAIGLAQAGTTAGLRTAAIGLTAAADVLNISRESLQLAREAELANLESNSDLEQLEFEIAQANLELQNEILAAADPAEAARLEALVNQLNSQLELELAFERDLVELNDRRDDLYNRLLERFSYEQRVLQAQLAIEQAMLNYQRIVQTAGLERAGLEMYRGHRDQFVALFGSPQALFSNANRLEEAERELYDAKEALLDWLVAIEFFAVRPFFDERMSILLARNTFQLEAIADRLLDLQDECGGRTNDEAAVVSLRRDLLGMTDTVQDLVTGSDIAPEDRFRETLQRGFVPISQRVRYSVGDTIGSLLADRDVWAASFAVNLSDFANLASTCNAKVAAVSINLVGENLGTGRPVVTLLYDGTSQVFSCQPGIDEYVESFGSGASTFGSITAFQVAGRSVSPIAGVGEFPSDDLANRTLDGLPLASRYTVLIDPALPANSGINWENLDDIELRFQYTYQDVFAVGACGQ